MEEEASFEEQEERVENPMKRLFREYLADYPVQIAAGFVFSISSRILDLIPPLILAIAIDSIFLNEKKFGLPLLPASYTPSDRGLQLGVSISIIAIAFLIGAVAHWGRNWGWNSLAQHVQHDVRVDTYQSMQRLNMTFFSDKQTGEMMSILSNDVNRLETFLNQGLNSFFRLIIMVIGIGFVLLYINWQLALIALLPVPVLGIFTYVFIRIIQPKYEKVRSTVGELNSRLENNLGGIQIIKSSTTEKYEIDRVNDVSREYLDSNWNAIKTRIKFFPGLRLVAGIGFIATFTVGGYWVLYGAPLFLSGELAPGELVLFIIYTQRFIWPLAQFGDIVNNYQKARASTSRIFGLMDEPSRIIEKEGAEDMKDVDGSVTYDDVSFGYDDDMVIQNIDMDINPGEDVALAGPTGAGKSTVLKLLMRMYDVDSGSIRVDGSDIRNISIKSLRDNIGYVGQETYLFYGTVADNISYGTFEATEEEIVEAAKKAEAHKFITNLPEGYDTMVGERGVKLSGGQRQRLAIARAILQDPAILILDEATSDVDTETELLIQKSLDSFTDDITTISIAHRLSTIKNSDKIFVVDDGEIVENGTHSELLSNDGLYTGLWKVQAGEIEDLPEGFLEDVVERRSKVSDDE